MALSDRFTGCLRAGAHIGGARCPRLLNKRFLINQSFTLIGALPSPEEDEQVIDFKQRIQRASNIWTVRACSAASKAYLQALTSVCSYTAEALLIKCVHASDTDFAEWIVPENAQRLQSLGQALDADIIVMGHTHCQFMKQMDNRYFINPGSVGRPLDGDPRASFAILEIRGTSVQVIFKRVAYDIESNIAHLISHGLPPEIGYSLRNGVDQYRL